MKNIEIYSSGCPFCEEAVRSIKNTHCSECTIKVNDIRDKKVLKKAKKLGITRVPAIVVDNHLADCCKCQEIDIK